MPRKKVRPIDLTTEEAMQQLFPKRVRDAAKKTASEAEKKATKKDDK